MNRYLTYAAIYGAVGVCVGLALAHWTKDGQSAAIPILLRKHTKTVEEPSA